MCLSPNIVRVIKSRRLKWEGHIARMADNRSDFRILTGTLTGGRRPLGRPRRRREEKLEWILNKQVSMRGIGLVRLRIGIIGELL